MSVFYAITNLNPHTGELVEMECSGGCFGSLNSTGPMPTYSIIGGRRILQDGSVQSVLTSGSNRLTDHQRRVEGFVFHVGGNNATNVMFNGELRSDARAAGRTFNAYAHQLLVELFNDIPYYRDMVWFDFVDHPTIPLLNMYFKIEEDTPADKVITAAFLARNLMQNQDYISYKHFLSLGYRPHFAAILATMMDCRPDNGVNPFTRSDVPQGRVSMRGLGEYNWVHPSGIGKEGVIQLLTGEEPEWQLESWLSLQGYRREGYFSGRGMTINGRGQNLVDWATISGDNEHFLSQLSWSTGSGRFTPSRALDYATVLQDISNFADFLNTEYNINVRN